MHALAINDLPQATQVIPDLAAAVKRMPRVFRVRRGRPPRRLHVERATPVSSPCRVSASGSVTLTHGLRIPMG